jgi:hypothetical protein
MFFGMIYSAWGYYLSSFIWLVGLWVGTFASNGEIGRDGRLFEKSGQEIIEDVL